MRVEKKVPIKAEPVVIQEPPPPPAPVVTPALRVVAPPVQPVAQFERARSAEAHREDPAARVIHEDSNAALASSFDQLAALVETGPKPPPGMRPSRAGMLEDAAPLEHGLPLKEVMQALTSQEARAPGLVREEIHEVMLAVLAPTLEQVAALPAMTAPREVLDRVGALIAQHSLRMSKSNPKKPFDQIEIPSPAVVAIERGISSGGLDISTMDVETAAMVIMFQASAGSKDDLRDMLKEMEGTRQKKDAMRKYMESVRESKARAESRLRAEYNERRRLPQNDPDHVPASVTFEDYCRDRPLAFPTDADGVFDPNGDASFDQPWSEYSPDARPASEPRPNDGPIGTGGPSTTDPTPPAAVTSTAAIDAAAQKYHLTNGHMTHAAKLYDTLVMLVPGFEQLVPSFEDFLAKPQLPADMLGKVSGKLPELKGLSESANASTNDETLRAVGAALAPLLTKDAMIARADEVYREVFLLELFLKMSPELPDLSKKAIEAELAKQRRKLDRVLYAGEKLHGSQLSVDVAQRKIAVATEMKSSMSKVLLGVAQTYPAIELGKIAFQGSRGNHYAAGSVEQRIIDDPFIAQILKLGKTLGFGATTFGDLLRLEGDQAKNLTTQADAAISRLASELKTAQAAHAKKPNPGCMAEVQSALSGVRVHRREYEGASSSHRMRSQEGKEEGPAPEGSLPRPPDNGPAPRPESPPPKPKTPPKPQETPDGTLPPPPPPVESGPEQPPQTTPTPTEPPPDVLTEVPTRRVRGQRASATFANFDLILDTTRDTMDSLSDLNQTQQLRMQMYVDAMTGIHSTLSNLLKKLSDTAGGIIANLK